MNHSERIDKVVLFPRDDVAQLLDVRLIETRLQSEHLEPTSTQLQRLTRELDRSKLSPGTRKVRSIGPDAAAYFEDLLSPPALELRELGDVRLDEILSSLHLVEVLAGADLSLASERTHVLRTLPLGVLRGLGDAVLHSDPNGLWRAAAIIVGLIWTIAGYVRGMLPWRKMMNGSTEIDSVRKIELTPPVLAQEQVIDNRSLAPSDI